MSHNDRVFTMIEEQCVACTEISTPEVDICARNIAFFAAMIDAATEDPLDDDADQGEILEYLQGRMLFHVERYQEMMNVLL
jgi:hypothetical protein